MSEFQFTVDWWRFLVFLGWPDCWFCLRQCSVLTRGACNSKSQNPLLLSVVIDEGLDGVMQQEPANHCIWNSCFCISLKTNTWSITAVRLTSLLPSIHSVIHTSIHPSIFTQYPLCLDTSPSSSRIIPRHSQDSRVLQSLPRVLLLTRGLLLARCAWDTSPGRLPGGHLIQMPDPLSSDHLPGDKASHPISQVAPLQPAGWLLVFSQSSWPQVRVGR